MQLSISMPLDGGFLRRQCPNCNREFKWHAGPTEDRPIDAMDPPFYYCPYCGSPAGHDAWWTEAQLDYASKLAMGEVSSHVANGLGRLAKRHTGGFIKFSVRSDEEPEPPEPLVEPSDMTAVASPCHPWEPIKVLDDWTSGVHCLVCGLEFALS